MLAIDPIFGHEPKAVDGWVPSPGYLLRRNRILHHMVSLSRDLDLLEVGCGAGALIADFRTMGHRCTAVETGDAAREAAAKLHAEDPAVQVVGEVDPAWQDAFDLLVAFEVLEHIEDDTGALTSWVKALRPGGTLIVSMPGGPHRWDASDEWAGHFRRYTRQSMRELGEAAGAEVELIESYGFPLANIIAPLRARAKKRAGAAETIEARTAGSGVDRGPERRLLPYLKSWPGKAALRTCFTLQGMAAKTDMGPAFLMKARKL